MKTPPKKNYSVFCLKEWHPEYGIRAKFKLNERNGTAMRRQKHWNSIEIELSTLVLRLTVAVCKYIIQPYLFLCVEETIENSNPYLGDDFIFALLTLH